MRSALLLASASPIRLTLLRNAGLSPEVHPARVDEAAIKSAVTAEGGSPRDLADHLAELKALKISARHPQALTLGCDQVLALGPRIFSKPETRDEAVSQLAALSGQTHQLLSAAVVAREGRPLWRHVGTARLTMHPLTPAEIESYLTATWPGTADSVGAYKLEERGIRLFSAIEGDHFTILGLPLLPLLNWLRATGEISP